MMKLLNKMAEIKKNILKVWKNEEGVGVVEVILILVVLIGLVTIFRNQLTDLVNGIFQKIASESSGI